MMKRSIKSQVVPVAIMLPFGVLLLALLVLHGRIKSELISQGLWSDWHASQDMIHDATAMLILIVFLATVLVYDHLLWKEKTKDKRTEPADACD